MRWGLRLLAGLAVLLPAAAAFAAEAGPSREETLTLQQRLTDAGCYPGARRGGEGLPGPDAVPADRDRDAPRTSTLSRHIIWVPAVVQCGGG